MAKFISLYVKKKIELGRLSFDQKQMAMIGNFALWTFKGRLYNAVNANDAPAKPLSKGYAIWKSKMMSGKAGVRDRAANQAMERLAASPAGQKILKLKNPRRAMVKKMRGLIALAANRVHSNRRDYCVTGEFLDNLSLRQVSENGARIRWTKDELRNRAIALSNKEEFVAWSPNDKRATCDFARPLLNQVARGLIAQK